MEQPQTSNSYRKLLTMSLSAILLDCGFDAADKDAIETLAEMLQCFFTEIASLSRNYCELAGRTDPVIGDVVLGFVEMGISFANLDEVVRMGKHVILPTPLQQQPQKQLTMLQAGSKQSLPSHIPQHFPAFPDPHSYIRTPTHKQPVIDYEAIREKFAIQKKDMEKALTKFLCRTNPTNNLFDNEEGNLYPLIACKATHPPYLGALLPMDQIFDSEDVEYDAKAQTQNHMPRKRLRKLSDSKMQIDEGDDIKEEIKTEEKESLSWDIDNPYLTAAKLPIKEEPVGNYKFNYYNKIKL